MKQQRGASPEVEVGVSALLSYQVSPPFPAVAGSRLGTASLPSSQPGRHHDGDDPDDSDVDDLSPLVLALQVSPLLRVERVWMSQTQKVNYPLKFYSVLTCLARSAAIRSAVACSRSLSWTNSWRSRSSLSLVASPNV